MEFISDGAPAAPVPGDDATRESSAPLPVGGARISRLLDEVATQHELPEEIAIDNWPEFTGRSLLA